MPQIYSADLRQKVMDYYTECQNKSQTWRIFKISRTTLDDWILLQQTTGQLKQPKIKNSGRPRIIKDWQAFQLFVESSHFSQAKDLLPLFEQQFGYAISYPVMLLALHRLGWTRKKRVLFMSSVVK